jgi:Tol biopolymer transport system component
MTERRRVATFGVAVMVAAGVVLSPVVGLAAVPPGPRAGLELRVVSTDQTGVPGDASSQIAAPSLSVNGRYVAFLSRADNLVAGDFNGLQDAFVKDRQTGAVERVSVGAATEANDRTVSVTISADGRYVAFASDASNLVLGDSNGARDVFVRDLTAQTTVRVSQTRTGVEGNGASEAPAITSTGLYVAFQSEASNLIAADTNSSSDVFVKNLVSGTVERVSLTSTALEANGHSSRPALSLDGRYVAFASTAPNVVAGDTNGVSDVFVRDRKSKTTDRVSVDSGGAQGNLASADTAPPAISSTGRYVAFASNATNLTFAADTNQASDVFVRDRSTARTVRVSVDHQGVSATGISTAPAISADGRYVAFTSAGMAQRSRDAVYVRDQTAGTTEMVNLRGDNSVEANWAENPAISADGQAVAFTSLSLSLAGVAGFGQTYVKGPAVAFNPNCDFGESSIECDLVYSNAVGSVGIRWTVNSMHVPSADGLRLVSFPCTPDTPITIKVKIVDANGPALDERTYPCLSDAAP